MKGGGKKRKKKHKRRCIVLTHPEAQLAYTPQSCTIVLGGSSSCLAMSLEPFLTCLQFSTSFTSSEHRTHTQTPSQLD